MSQADKEARLRVDLAGVKQTIAACERDGRRPFAVDLRRMREMTRDLAKIEARKTAQSAPAGRDLAAEGNR